MKTSAAPEIQIPPMDQFNKTLIENVHPPDWKNPTPTGRYNLVVIGAGTAGLVTAAGAAGLGAKVALVERHLMGGDCLNVGCVPSKLLIRAAKAQYELTHSALFGIKASGSAAVDFTSVMERLRAIRAHISKHDSAKRFTALGVDVFLGDARFCAADAVEVNGQTLRFKRAVIATGARPTEPPIPGLKAVGFLTNETVFSLTELPKRLAVIGGGPIGCELSQAFRRLGSDVTIFNNGPHFLAKEDADAADILRAQFEQEGIQVKLASTITKVEAGADGKKLFYTTNGEEDFCTVDQILVGVGRSPNIETLDLEKVSVKANAHGIEVNDKLQTSNPRIYAAGDVCMKWKFTHAADFAARAVIQNALFFGKKKLSSLTIPWATYTDPEIAHVGLYPHEAEQQGIAIESFTKQFRDVDRALIDGDEIGFVKVHVKQGTDKIVGATIVGRHAGEMIGEVALALQGGIGLKKLANVIHPYPTQAEAIRQVGDLYNRTRLTTGVKRMFEIFLRFSR